MICGGCATLTGNEKATSGSFYVAEVHLSEVCNNAIEIHISYVGGTLSVGPDFTGQRNIVIPAGSSTSNFQLSINDNSHGTIKINIESQTVNICSEEITVEVVDDSEMTELNNSIFDSSNCADKGFFWNPYGHTTRIPEWMK